MALKVFSGLSLVSSAGPVLAALRRAPGFDIREHVRQVQTVVVASSQKRVIELLHVSRVEPHMTLGHLRTYWGSGRTGPYQAALQDGECVLVRKNEHFGFVRDHFVKVWPEA